MGRKIVNNRERIIQKSIGFYSRQMDFIHDTPDFKPDKFCREIIDEQIKLHGKTEYLE